MTKRRHYAGGSRIGKIRKDSKADITINKKERRKDIGRIVVITGTLQQIETAKILLKNALQFQKGTVNLQNSRNNPCNRKINFKN